MKSPETSNQLNSEPSYKNDHTYIYMISLLEDRKNLESIRSTLVIAREQPEAFGDLFLNKYLMALWKKLSLVNEIIHQRCWNLPKV